MASGAGEKIEMDCIVMQHSMFTLDGGEIVYRSSLVAPVLQLLGYLLGRREAIEADGDTLQLIVKTIVLVNRIILVVVGYNPADTNGRRLASIIFVVILFAHHDEGCYIPFTNGRTELTE